MTITLMKTCYMFEPTMKSMYGVKCRFWSHLGCLGRKVTIFAHSGSLRAVHKEVYKKNAVMSSSLVWSNLGASLSLSHTPNGLP